MQPVSLTSLAPLKHACRVLCASVSASVVKFGSEGQRDMSQKGQDLVFMGSSVECSLGPETPNPHISKPLSKTQAPNDDDDPNRHEQLTPESVKR